MADQCADGRATEIVLTLLGGRWVWPLRTVVEHYEAPARRINLTGRPVVSVESVVDSRTGEDVWFDSQLFNRSAILLPGYAAGRRSRGGWVRGAGPPVGCDASGYDVTYTYGAEPPGAVLRAIRRLDSELSLAASGQPCSLPERVTSVTRQGMSWTVLDPQDFLSDGRTGLYEVDLALSTYNPSKAKARARVFSPEFPPGLRYSRG